jgi:hypothetical protein
MNRFSFRFLVALITFLFGVGAFTVWYLLREPARSEISRTGADSKIETGPKLQWTELNAVLKRHDLHASLAQHDSEVTAIEEADARLYEPFADATLFISADVPTEDSEGVKPRFWLRVEDYSTAESAQKRALEYISDEAGKRMAKAYGRGDSFIMSKFSLRLWAVARGKRVYALTTNANLLTYINLPKKLKQSILELPEI